MQDCFEDEENVHLVMELCEGGALLERIESRMYSEKYIVQIVRSILRFISQVQTTKLFCMMLMTDICMFLSQCHAKGFIYRDVKPDNFLFETRSPTSPLKATDFGLSIKHWPDEPKLTARSGTPAYM
jgi:calcium-dependent protein kinase